MDGLAKLLGPGDSGWIDHSDIIVKEDRSAWIKPSAQIAQTFDDIYHDVYVVCEDTGRFTIYMGLAKYQCRSVTDETFETCYDDTIPVSKIIDEIPDCYEPELEE